MDTMGVVAVAEEWAVVECTVVVEAADTGGVGGGGSSGPESYTAHIKFRPAVGQH